MTPGGNTLPRAALVVAVLLVAAMLLSLVIGAYPLAISKLLSGQLNDAEWSVLTQLRAPRVLAACAGGAARSAHMRSFALDFTPMDESDITQKLCDFWRAEGKNWNMGLSRYPSGRIHIDTAGFRTWGVNKNGATPTCAPCSPTSSRRRRSSWRAWRDRRWRWAMSSTCSVASEPRPVRARRLRISSTWRLSNSMRRSIS